MTNQPDFDFWAAKLDQAVGRAITEACLLVQAEARENSRPVDTGKLMQSIDYQVQKDVDGWHGVVGTNVEYAPFVEFGTGIYALDGNGRKTPWFVVLPNGEGFFTNGMRPRLFLTNAAYQNKSAILNLIKTAIRSVT